MKLTRFDKNVHQLDIGGTEMKLAIMGDLHWDSPYCDREKLKKDLDYCLDNSIHSEIVTGKHFCQIWSVS